MRQGFAFGLLLLLGLIFGSVFASPIEVDYNCNPIQLPLKEGYSQSEWVSSRQGKVTLPPDMSECWVRLKGLDSKTSNYPSGLSFSDLNVLRVNIELFDSTGRELALARRVGKSHAALVTGARAVFQPDQTALHPLFARLTPVEGTVPIPGISRSISVEDVNPAVTLREEQTSDLLNQSGAVFLLTTGLIALFFGIALRDLDYSIYFLYATLQALTIFTKSGLPFALDGNSAIWLNPWLFQYAVAVLSLLLSVRFGRFLIHSPKTSIVAYGVAVAFLLLIPFHFVNPALGAKVIFFLVPLHFLVLLSGNWRGWRSGERGCGILLLGLTPITAYWVVFFLYEVFLHEPIPAEFAIGSAFDFFRTLVLPLAFCYGIAERGLLLQRESLRLAQFDPLTGMHNREGLRQFGQEVMNRGAHPCAVMLNIERFRAINDTLGSMLGDQILKETARRLNRICSKHRHTRLGRTHADQFCIFLSEGHQQKNLQQEIEKEFSTAAEIEGQAVDIALAAGFSQGVDKTHDMSQLMRNAEVALESSRTQQKNWTQYHVDLETSHRADLDLLSELKRAVEQNELQVFLQPKVRLSDGMIVSAEALVRWFHPKRGMIPPADFVPFAEKTGRITLLTQWILGESMRFVAQRRAVGKPLQVSVNLSAFDLTEHGFAEKVASLGKQMGIDTNDIRLEITESGAMSDPAYALQVMNQLRNAGFSLSIDDFGTGYSSLAYLQKMPVAELKIDRAFVRNVASGSEGAVLLDSTIALGKRLGLSVVAEGAETREEWTLLQQLGCDYAQGWFAAKPMPISEFEQWCVQHTPFTP